MSNVIHVDFTPKDEENLHPAERKWGPQHAGIVKDYEPGLQEEE
jgi:hypothetical protein